jgi:PAS domain S-box-containing protein
MDPQTIVEIAVGVATFLTYVVGAIGAVAGAIGTVWVFFRKRIRKWWEPYRAGLQGAAAVPRLQGAIETLEKAMHLMTMHMRAQGDTDIERGQFETDETGALTYVNLTYARWLGVGKAELLGWGWVNYILPDDRIRVRGEWDACRAEHRVFNIRFRMLDSGGDSIPVDVLATPIPESPPAKRWLGVIRRVVD